MAEESTQGVHMSVEVQDMDQVLRHIPDGARRHQAAVSILTALSMKARAEIVKRMPVRTAATRRSVGARVYKGTETGIVGDFLGSRQRVARWLEEGTGLFGPRHERIYPKHARALRWPQGTIGPGGNLRLSGQFRRKRGLHSVIRPGGAADAGPVANSNFARSIAGMRAQPSFRPGWESTIPFIPVVLQEVGRRALQGETFELDGGTD